MSRGVRGTAPGAGRLLEPLSLAALAVAINRSTSQYVTLAMLVLASITVLTLDYHGEANHAITHVRNGVHDVLSPFQRSLQSALHPVGDVVSGAIHYGSLETQNQRLQNELGAQRRGEAEADAEQRASNQVLRLSHLNFANNIPAVPGEVIGMPTSNFEFSMELGLGTSSGVGKGMPVIADTGKVGGLIGTVLNSSGSTSQVLLMTDPRSSVDVVLSSGGNWVATGQGRGNHLALREPTGTGAPAHVGDIVYTSGLGGGAYPAGIPIGTVNSVRASNGGFSQSVLVTPFVNFDEIQYVSVLQWLQPA